MPAAAARSFDGPLVEIVVDPDEGAYVEGADVRVQTLSGIEVDQLQRVLRAGDGRSPQLVGVARQGEDAAVVLGVEVAVVTGRWHAASPIASTTRSLRPSE